MDSIVNKHTLAGFELYGYIQKDKTIMLSNHEKINEFPSEITLYGNTYTLENITKGNETELGVFCNAIYV